MRTKRFHTSMSANWGDVMRLKARHWDRIGNGGLTFTELGFGAAPIGNLYRAVRMPKLT